MPKKILLVGHCGADTSYLRLAVRAADKDAVVVPVEDQRALQHELLDGAALVLFNRELGYGFDGGMGIEMIEWMHVNHFGVKTMLVSNYPEAQDAAVAAGALPGFGKRELGSKRVAELLRDALSGDPKPAKESTKSRPA